MSLRAKLLTDEEAKEYLLRLKERQLKYHEDHKDDK